jgi:transketolase
VGSLGLELSHREEEATRCESDFSIRENELVLERLRLETLEGQLEDSQASYDDRLARANAQFVEKEKGLQEMIAQKFPADLEKVRVEHHCKHKLQEARFTEKKKALEDAKKKLEVELQGVRASLDKVTQAKDAAAGEASSSRMS